jgi:hypothetical protein
MLSVPSMIHRGRSKSPFRALHIARTLTSTPTSEPQNSQIRVLKLDSDSMESLTKKVASSLRERRKLPPTQLSIFPDSEMTETSAQSFEVSKDPEFMIQVLFLSQSYTA